MTRQKTKNAKKPSTLKKITVVVGLFTSIFGGMFAVIVSVDSFINYNSPYIFTFTFGTIGLIIGLIASKMLKPYIILNPKMRTNYSNLAFAFSFGFIGCSIFLGHHLNSMLSHLHKCDNFRVIDTEFRKSGYRQPQINALIINIENETYRLHCSPNYWETVSIGKMERVCIYKSKIGFDYLTLPDEK